jgi:hypothetical protein
MGEESKSVTIANIQRPFWSMVFVTVKWAIASISALVILSVVFGAAWLVFLFITGAGPGANHPPPSFETQQSTRPELDKSGPTEQGSVSRHTEVTTRERALELFDSLEPVDIDFMIGRWRGEGYPTGHPLDGQLEAFHWYGKLFESSKDVHPLLYLNRHGDIVSIDPGALGSGGEQSSGDQQRTPPSRIAVKIFQLLMPLLSTSESRARLRMTEYRGKLSATMIYDQLPINDVFRKLDDNTVLAVMDNKNIKDPFFFKLIRDQGI